MSDLGEKLKYMGVVGAGGAGFPTYVKASARVELVIANGAECEPLVHKDFELMKNFPREVVSGMNLMREATGADRAQFALKKKYKSAADAVRSHLDQASIGMLLLGDFYPSGDEYELVYIATGKRIPPAGIPLQVGCVVNNVETLYNVHRAGEGIPVTHKLISVAGEVVEPQSFWVPIGTSFRDVLSLAGGAAVSDFGLFVNGLMMGRLTFDLDDVVTKTTAGLIVLPRSHPLVVRRSRPLRSMNRIGKSACDQCSYCTELCPRYLLGYEVMPHKVMRSLGFTLTGSQNWNQWAELCCSCGLCTLYACPEDLYPKEACDQGKTDLQSAGVQFTQKKDVRVHPMKEARRVPLALLRRRLKVEQYERPSPFHEIDFTPQSVKVRLSQQVGKAATPTVQEGDHVEQGACIAKIGEEDLGVHLHASINGTVKTVTDHFVEIEA
jgi:Na+-translocating ferredoxin:NAD+ oxidoreductase RnfC subunit